MVVTVTRPIPDSPAEKAGILAGDEIVEVDGEDIVGDDLNVTVAKIRGKAGTKVKIGVKREGRDGVIRFDIVRASVESMTVDSKMLDNSIGYIQIAEFDDITTSQFLKAFTALKREEMRGLILDLRDNPGGSVRTCVDIADELLPEGLIVYTEERDGTRDEYTSSGDNYYDGPLVVLVNGNSASAAEILTGAIKDYKTGTILGTTTYGKGIVQRILPLGDGTGVKLTIAKYFTPNGEDIHGLGIEPDEELELDVDAYLEDGSDNQLDRAVEIIEEQLKGK
jgi:carboxyl-terminal processing protease